SKEILTGKTSQNSLIFAKSNRLRLVNTIEKESQFDSSKGLKKPIRNTLIEEVADLDSVVAEVVITEAVEVVVVG
ncbi:18926_t:CDS:2, partial [Dentiscutata erythropus]